MIKVFLNMFVWKLFLFVFYWILVINIEKGQKWKKKGNGIEMEEILVDYLNIVKIRQK